LLHPGSKRWNLLKNAVFFNESGTRLVSDMRVLKLEKNFDECPDLWNLQILNRMKIRISKSTTEYRYIIQGSVACETGMLNPDPKIFVLPGSYMKRGM
jgi:hypothetical protein